MTSPGGETMTRLLLSSVVMVRLKPHNDSTKSISWSDKDMMDGQSP